MRDSKVCAGLEEIWGDSVVGEPSSVVMERCIQKCQAEKIHVPKRFYDRKHWIEDHEESDEVSRVAGPRGLGAAFAHLVKLGVAP